GFLGADAKISAGNGQPFLEKLCKRWTHPLGRSPSGEVSFLDGQAQLPQNLRVDEVTEGHVSPWCSGRHRYSEGTSVILAAWSRTAHVDGFPCQPDSMLATARSTGGVAGDGVGDVFRSAPRRGSTPAGSCAVTWSRRSVGPVPSNSYNG